MLKESDNVDLAASLRSTMAELVAARVPHPETAHAKQAVRVGRTGASRVPTSISGDPRYREAIEFFLRELYGDVDMTARDADVARVLPLMIRMLPAVALETIRDALAFEALSERLDSESAQHLGARPLDLGSYGEAFRHAGSGMPANNR